MSPWSAVEWTDAERGCCFGTCGGDTRQHAPHEDQGCAMFEDMLRYLAPFVAAREEQAAEKALRRVLGLSHLYDPVTQAHNAALMQRGPQGHGGGMP